MKRMVNEARETWDPQPLSVTLSGYGVIENDHHDGAKVVYRLTESGPK